MSPPPLTSCAYPALPAPAGVRLAVLPEHPCAYLPDRMAQNRALLAESMRGEVYHELMDAGFRRSGKLIYQPVCRGCRACVPIRIPTAGFVPTRSQARCRRRNEDLAVEVGPPFPTGEKFELYRRYASERHGDEHADDPEAFCAFLYDSPVDTLEFVYRDGRQRLLAVGICDVCTSSLSSVYFYFDPDEMRRGLGTYGIVYEIEYARLRGIPHYYLGYWIGGCRTMQYKADFGPHELLGPDGRWRENDCRSGGEIG